MALFHSSPLKTSTYRVQKSTVSIQPRDVAIRRATWAAKKAKRKEKKERNKSGLWTLHSAVCRLHYPRPNYSRPYANLPSSPLLNPSWTPLEIHEHWQTPLTPLTPCWALTLHRRRVPALSTAAILIIHLVWVYSDIFSLEPTGS